MNQKQQDLVEGGGGGEGEVVGEKSEQDPFSPLVPKNESDDDDYFGKDMFEAGTTSFCQTLMNILKGSIGIGVLALPLAISQAGLLVGPVAMVIIGLMVLVNMLTLRECNLILARRNNKPRLGFAGTLKYATLPYVGHHSKYVAYLTNSFLVLYQTGSCAAYVLVASESMQNVTGNLFQDVRVWIVIFTAPVLLLSLISRIETISIISGCANFLCLAGLIGTVIYICPLIRTPIRLPLFTNFPSLLDSLTTLVFSFEGITSMLPVLNCMRVKEDYRRILCLSNSFTIGVYICIACLGYLALGSEVKNPITLSLPSTWVFNSVKIVYTLGVVLSFIVLLYCNITIIMPAILKRCRLSAFRKFIVEAALRLVIVVAGVAMALGIPNFDRMLTILGAFGSSPMSLIIPPFVHILTYHVDQHKDRALWYRSLVFNVVIIATGFSLCAAGVYTTICRPQ